MQLGLRAFADIQQYHGPGTLKLLNSLVFLSLEPFSVELLVSLVIDFYHCFTLTRSSSV